MPFTCDNPPTLDQIDAMLDSLLGGGFECVARLREAYRLDPGVCGVTLEQINELHDDWVRTHERRSGKLGE